MSGATNASGEDLDGEEEGCDVGSGVEEELREGEQRDEAAGGGMVGDAGPDGIKDSDDDAAPELLAHATDEVGEKDADVEAGEVALVWWVSYVCIWGGAPDLGRGA